MMPQMLQQLAQSQPPGASPMGGPPPSPSPMGPGAGGPQGPMPGGPAGPQGAGGVPMQLAQQASQQMGQGGQVEGLSSLVAQLAKHLVSTLVQVPQAAQFQAGKELMETFRKWSKAEATVPAMVPKMAATTPMSGPNTGRADQSALAQAGAMQQAGMPPRGMPPGGGPPGMPARTPMPGQLGQLAGGRM